jgi:hypothetical protein
MNKSLMATLYQQIQTDVLKAISTVLSLDSEACYEVNGPSTSIKFHSCGCGYAINRAYENGQLKTTVRCSETLDAEGSGVTLAGCYDDTGYDWWFVVGGNSAKVIGKDKFRAMIRAAEELA